MEHENQNENIKKHRIVRSTAAALCIATLCIGAVSYFTDFHNKTISSKAGTFDLTLSDVTADLSNGLTIINPGDSNPFGYTITNAGEKSMDVKTVITIDAGSTVNSSDSEYKLLDAATGKEISDVSGDGFTTMATKQVTGNQIIYTMNDMPLAGSVEKDESTDGTATASHQYNLKFKMDEDSKNAFAGKAVSVKVESYAKQHRNTQTADAANWHTDGKTIKEFESVGSKTIN